MDTAAADSVVAEVLEASAVEVSVAVAPEAHGNAKHKTNVTHKKYSGNCHSKQFPLIFYIHLTLPHKNDARTRINGFVCLKHDFIIQVLNFVTDKISHLIIDRRI